MGHDTEAKAYRCYVPSRKIVVVSRDVKFTNDSAIITEPKEEQIVGPKKPPRETVFFDFGHEETTERVEEEIVDTSASEASDESYTDDSYSMADETYRPSILRIDIEPHPTDGQRRSNRENFWAATIAVSQHQRCSQR